MFSGCFSLSRIPPWQFAQTTNTSIFNGIFTGGSATYSLSRVEASGFNQNFSVASARISATGLNEIYTNLPVVTGKTITVTSNFGTTSDDPSIATAKGWTVTG